MTLLNEILDLADSFELTRGRRPTFVQMRLEQRSEIFKDVPVAVRFRDGFVGMLFGMNLEIGERLCVGVRVVQGGATLEYTT